MIEAILGSQSKEQVLLYIVGKEQGYARAIAEYFGCAVTPIKKQLELLEAGGVLISETIGKVRLFSMNPRWPFREELINLIKKEISFLDESERERLLNSRMRPRRTGKPL